MAENEVLVPEFEIEAGADGEHNTVWFSHICANGEVERCTLPTVIWRISQLEPLTITPSVNCSLCGMHGWIREGVWQPA